MKQIPKLMVASVAFLASRTQQSISTSFLAKYLQPQPKADYRREVTSSIRSLSAMETLDELAEDLIEQDLLGSEILTLAHDENIEIWIKSVRSTFGIISRR